MLRSDLRAPLSAARSARRAVAESASESGSAPALQRATGRLELVVGLRAGRSRLVRHREQGCAKARFPRPEPGGPFETVLVNTAGGLAGGDRIDQVLRVEPGAALLACGQAAEKVYRSLGPTARIVTRLEVARGGALLWLPQETILFDGARLDRALELELAGDARALLVESVVLGRTARGEQVVEGRLVDRRSIRLDGRLVRLERLRLEGPIATLAERPAILDGARAFASILALGPGVEALVEPLRERLSAGPARAACGFCAPTLVVRILAVDGWALRRALTPALELLVPALGGPGGLPRVWRF